MGGTARRGSKNCAVLGRILMAQGARTKRFWWETTTDRITIKKVDTGDNEKLIGLEDTKGVWWEPKETRRKLLTDGGKHLAGGVADVTKGGRGPICLRPE